MEKHLKYELAVERYSRIIAQNDKDFRAFNNRGIAYEKLRRYIVTIYLPEQHG